MYCCGCLMAAISGHNIMSSFLFSGEAALRCEERRGGCSHNYFVAIDDITDEFTAVHVEFIRSK